MWSSRPSWRLFLNPNLHPPLLPRKNLPLASATQRVKLKLHPPRQSPFSNGKTLRATTPTAVQTTSCHALRPNQPQVARSVSTCCALISKGGVIRGFIICIKLSVNVENQEVGGGWQLPDFRWRICSSCTCGNTRQALSCQKTSDLRPGLRLWLSSRPFEKKKKINSLPSYSLCHVINVVLLLSLELFLFDIYVLKFLVWLTVLFYN